MILAALCSLAALLVPTLASADTVRADLDGDGVRDQIEFRRGTRDLAIRFSSTQRWQQLHVKDLIVRFVLADVDRDGHPDLIANTGASGFRIWINKGRGFFAARNHSRSRHFKISAQHARPTVRAVQTLNGDDSALNDTTRLLMVASAPARARLIVVCEAPLLGSAPLANIAGRRRTPRGPPAILAS